MLDFSIAVAAGLILAAPALAGGGEGGVAGDSGQYQVESEPAGMSHRGPVQESIGTACSPGPLLEELTGPSIRNGAWDARTHEAVRSGTISL